MPTAFVTTFAKGKKEPLNVLVERVYAAFHAAGEVPSIRFSLSEGAFSQVSSVERVLKRHPELARFTFALPMPAQGAEVARAMAALGRKSTPTRVLSNLPPSPGAGEAVPIETLTAIAAGVPRSFPFHGVMMSFHTPAFGKDIQTRLGVNRTGVTVTDSWWVNNRQRSLSALATVDENPASAGANVPEVVAAILASCGKVRKAERLQVLYADMDPAAVREAVAESTQLAAAVKRIQVEYRNRLAEVVANANLPHDLASATNARKVTLLRDATGPKKPALIAAFSPLGYECSFDSGTFSLVRHRPHNITVEVSIDVGTWSRKLEATLLIRGPAFRTSLSLPVTRSAEDYHSYPLGDEHRWHQLVENLAAVVAELDRTFVPEVEAAAAP